MCRPRISVPVSVCLGVYKRECVLLRTYEHEYVLACVLIGTCEHILVQVMCECECVDVCMCVLMGMEMNVCVCVCVFECM